MSAPAAPGGGRARFSAKDVRQAGKRSDAGERLGEVRCQGQRAGRWSVRSRALRVSRPGRVSNLRGACARRGRCRWAGRARRSSAAGCRRAPRSPSRAALAKKRPEGSVRAPDLRGRRCRGSPTACWRSASTTSSASLRCHERVVLEPQQELTLASRVGTPRTTDGARRARSRRSAPRWRRIALECPPGLFGYRLDR